MLKQNTSTDPVTNTMAMTLEELDALIEPAQAPVILMEGRRSIPPAFYERAVAAGRFLAERYPHARFRSGNASGADEAFSKGVAKVDASRLQIVAPYRTHRLKDRFGGARYDSPESMAPDMADAITKRTGAASPAARGLVGQFGGTGRSAAKAAYLVRDTMKVAGFSEEFPKVAAALFYVDMEDPMAGGTGHTVRVCRDGNVPVIFQDAWSAWISGALP
jgi:hypothetical protein